MVRTRVIRDKPFSGFVRWSNQSCACARLLLVLKNSRSAATSSIAANPTLAPIPALAPVLRPLGGELIAADAFVALRDVVSVETKLLVEAEAFRAALMWKGEDETSCPSCLQSLSLGMKRNM